MKLPYSYRASVINKIAEEYCKNEKVPGRSNPIAFFANLSLDQSRSKSGHSVKKSEIQRYHSLQLVCQAQEGLSVENDNRMEHSMTLYLNMLRNEVKTN